MTAAKAEPLAKGTYKNYSQKFIQLRTQFVFQLNSCYRLTQQALAEASTVIQHKGTLSAHFTKHFRDGSELSFINAAL